MPRRSWPFAWPFRTLVERAVALLAALTLSACAGSGASTQTLQDPRPAMAGEAGDVVIVMHDPRGLRARRGVHGPGYGARLAYAEDPALRRAAARLARDHAFDIVEQWPLPSIDVHCLLARDLSPEALTALADDERVRWVQPFNEFRTRTTTSSSPAPAVRWLDQLERRLPERGTGVAVAVIDTAADARHPDLRDARLSHANFAGRRGLPEAEVHGTAVVGVLAARPAESKGVRGLASDADVALLRGCWQDESGAGVCNTLTIALALEAAIRRPPDLLNLSLSGGSDAVLEAQLDVLLDAGTLIVAAFDEQTPAAQRFPAPRAGIVYAYGSSAEYAARRDDSSGEAVVVHAPRDALTLAPGSAYDIASGHSIATPQIVALAARLMNRHPGASRPTILAMLEAWHGSQE